jgi:predicted DNA-binding transcriptional regulator AlpA
MICARTCLNREVTTSSGLDRLITEQATAEILGISPDTLRRLNRRGEGPTRRNISPRRVGYKLSEVEAYRDRKPLPTAKSTNQRVQGQAPARNQDERQSTPLDTLSNAPPIARGSRKAKPKPLR